MLPRVYQRKRERVESVQCNEFFARVLIVLRAIFERDCSARVREKSGLIVNYSSVIVSEFSAVYSRFCDAQEEHV